jgi:hypothetical protein
VEVSRGNSRKELFGISKLERAPSGLLSGFFYYGAHSLQQFTTSLSMVH